MTPDKVIQQSDWVERDYNYQASSSSSSWKPSLRSSGYNWELPVSGSSSWKDDPYNRELPASGGSGFIDYGDYSYDQSSWYDGGGHGTEADNPWCQGGEPDLHWPESPPEPRADVSRAKAGSSTTGGGKEPVAKKQKSMIRRAIDSTSKMAANISEMHVRKSPEPQQDAGQNFMSISDTRFDSDGVRAVELEE